MWSIESHFNHGLPSKYLEVPLHSRRDEMAPPSTPKAHSQLYWTSFEAKTRSSHVRRRFRGAEPIPAITSRAIAGVYSYVRGRMCPRFVPVVPAYTCVLLSDLVRACGHVWVGAVFICYVSVEIPDEKWLTHSKTADSLCEVRESGWAP